MSRGLGSARYSSPAIERRDVVMIGCKLQILLRHGIEFGLAQHIADVQEAVWRSLFDPVDRELGIQPVAIKAGDRGELR